MTEYTKVTIKKSVAEQGKVQAAAENRSLANYVEQLILSAGAVQTRPSHTPNQLKREDK